MSLSSSCSPSRPLHYFYPSCISFFLLLSSRLCQKTKQTKTWTSSGEMETKIQISVKFSWVVSLLRFCLSSPQFFFSLHPVCKAAKADLVFLIDGSWSIGDDNFLKIIRFLYSTTGALDRIGPDGTQVPQKRGQDIVLFLGTLLHSWHFVSASSPTTLFDWQVIEGQSRNTTKQTWKSICCTVKALRWSFPEAQQRTAVLGQTEQGDEREHHWRFFPLFDTFKITVGRVHCSRKKWDKIRMYWSFHREIQLLQQFRNQ